MLFNDEGEKKTMTYAIEKGVPFPEKKTINRWNEKFPFLPYMQVNDSFFIPDAHTNMYRSVPYNAARKLGMTLVRRKVTENGVPGHRVWRIK
jgi:hypothetical protein